MGCDIHMFIEYKCGNGMPWQADEHHQPVWEDRCRDDSPREKWCDHCIEAVDKGTTQHKCDNGYINYIQVCATSRNYQLFAALAGVRGRGPRTDLGLPNDVSEMVARAADYMGSDGHSHSYMSLDEFKKVLFEELDYKPTDRSDAFYEKWGIIGETDVQRQKRYDNRPPEYTTIVNYCEKLKEEKSVDKRILGPEFSSEVQIRLVFWFDN